MTPEQSQTAAAIMLARTALESVQGSLDFINSPSFPLAKNELAMGVVRGAFVGVGAQVKVAIDALLALDSPYNPLKCGCCFRAENRCELRAMAPGWVKNMGFPALICSDCLRCWYEDGMTDPEQIREKIQSQYTHMDVCSKQTGPTEDCPVCRKKD